MKLALHHINFATENVERMDRFYEEVLNLDEATEDLPTLERKKGYDGDVAFRSDGEIHFHLAKRDLALGFKTGHLVNPLQAGHIAFRTDDIEAFKQRLDKLEIPYSDFGNDAVKGWHQIFFYDPDGNVVEVHQVEED